MAILWGVDGGCVEQLEGREGAMEGRVHEGTALKVEAESCEDSSAEDNDSRVCVDRLGVTAWVDSRRGHEDTTLAVAQLQRVLQKK
jgi:hypothetical protein